MTLALRQQAVVDRNHTVHLQNAELVPGARVEVIVLVEAGARPAKGGTVSFLAGARQHAIDAPPDFSVTFEDHLSDRIAENRAGDRLSTLGKARKLTLAIHPAAEKEWAKLDGSIKHTLRSQSNELATTHSR